MIKREKAIKLVEKMHDATMRFWSAKSPTAKQSQAVDDAEAALEAALTAPCKCDHEWAAMREDRDMFQSQVESIRTEIRERLEAVMCDRTRCGHFLPVEILACCDKEWPPK